MTRYEKIFIALGFVGLIGILAWIARKPLPLPVAPGTPDEKEIAAEKSVPAWGPEYITYNMPWAFSPPLFFANPSKVARGVSQMVNPNNAVNSWEY